MSLSSLLLAADSGPTKRSSRSETKTAKTPGIEKNGSLGESQYWINQGLQTRTQLYSKAMDNNDFQRAIVIEKETWHGRGKKASGIFWVQAMIEHLLKTEPLLA